MGKIIKPIHFWLFITYLLLLGQVTRILGGSAAAQKPYVVPRIEGRIALDGMSTELAWENIQPLPLVMQTPTYQGTPTEQTEIRIGYDQDFIYIAGRCYMNSDDIRSVSFKRDQSGAGSDNLYLFFDTFDDNENGVGFITFPTGARTDFAVNNDAQGSFPVNVDWDTFWTVETARNGDGWFCEIRIPFTSLRFQEEHGRVEMGFITSRYTAIKNETVGYPAIQRKYGPMSWTKPSLARTVIFEGISSTRPLYITPYVTAGRGRYATLNRTETGYRQRQEQVTDVGLDVKVGLTRNLTLDVTVNPDFAQVEADNQQVNLTRFSLFYPEKRRFFQERASTFAFSFGRQDRLFYSRRVGLHQGEQVRILGGARLVGRVGPWDLGLIDMQTVRDAGLPAENMGVLRLQRQVFNPYSYIGGMTTSRIGQEGSYNLAYGLDGTIRLFGDDYLTWNWAQTFDETRKPDQEFLEAVHLRTKLERRTDVGLGYEVSYARAGAAYEPDLGFQLRHDYSRIGDRLFYGWLPEESSSFFKHAVAIHGEIFVRNMAGTLESAAVGPGWSGQFRNGGTFDVRLLRRIESIRRPFDLAEGVAVPAGDYAFTVLDGRYFTSFTRHWHASVDVIWGPFYDGNRMAAGLSPSWNVSRYLDVSGAYRFERVRFTERDSKFNAHILRLRVQGTLNTAVSAAAFLQYNSAIDAVITNLRFRYNPREGIDLYLVYNHGLNTDRYRMRPVLPVTDNRTVLIKYAHMVNIGI